MTVIKQRTITLEVFIQMIIVVRLITSLVEIINNKNEPKIIMTMMAFSFTFSELLPFCLVVMGIYLQIDWKKVKSNRSSKQIDLNSSTRSCDPLMPTNQPTIEEQIAAELNNQ
jgi:predicted transporter